MTTPRSPGTAPGNSNSSVDPEVFRAAFDASPSSMAILDADGRIVAVNRRWEQFSIDNGGERGAYLGAKYLEMVPRGVDVVLDRIHRRLSRLIDGHDRAMELEYPCHSPDRKRWFLMRALRFDGNGQESILVIHTDITARRLAEESAREAAATDALTGLYNRRSFQERAGQVLAQARRIKGSVVLIYIDLDDFKPINDRLGHAAGDAMLAEFASRLKDTLRECDVPARIGGDEFVVCCRIGEPEDTGLLLERLLPRLTAPMEIEDESIAPVLSLGVALWPQDAETLEELMDVADQAMYQAKAQSGTRVAFAAEGRSDDPVS